MHVTLKGSKSLTAPSTFGNGCTSNESRRKTDGSVVQSLRRGEAMKSDRKAAGLVEVNVARFSAEIDTELFNRAEKELAAFVAAVHTLHGEEQARTASNGWLLELIALKEPCKCALLDLRAATIGAARRLTQRLSVPSARHAVLAVIAGILLLA